MIMEYGKIAGIGAPFSRIVFGCGVARMQAGEDASDLLDAAAEAGVNAFDKARVYGKSEESLGRWLAARRREKVLVITKGCHPLFDGTRRVGKRYIEEDLFRSLDALKTDYVDLYLLHRDDETVPVGEILESLNAQAEAGRIRAFGGSNWTHARLQEANDYAAAHGLRPFAASSPYFGLAVQIADPWMGCLSVAGRENAAAQSWYRETQFPLLAYSSLAGGFLSGKVKSEQGMEAVLAAPGRVYGCRENGERLARAERLAAKKGCTVAQIALGWLFAQGLNAFALLSASAPERIRSDVQAATLTRAEADYLDLKEGVVNLEK